MAKFVFIEYNVRVERYDAEVDLWYTDYEQDTMYLNIDRIQKILPQNEHCQIQLIDGEKISANYTAKTLIEKIKKL